MFRIQIYLNKEAYEALKSASYKKHISVSEIIRRLVDNQILRKKTKRKKTAAGVLLSMSGLIHETKTDVAERHDDYLWGEDSCSK